MKLTEEQWKLAWTYVTSRLLASDGNPIEVTADQWHRFQHIANSKQLDPLQNQITMILHWDKRSKQYRESVITQIDGYRSVADRTEKYAGSDITYDLDEGVISATATVYKMAEVFVHGDSFPCRVFV